MRHRKRTIKLGRTSAHRDAMLANLVCSLIERRRIQTTLAKAKAARSLAERMVSLGKEGDLAARRQAVSVLRQKDKVRILFDEIVPSLKKRNGGYTRIVRLGQRRGDNAEMALLEWVDYQIPETRKKKSRKAAKEKSSEPVKESVSEPEGEKREEAAEQAEPEAAPGKKEPFWRRLRKRPRGIS